MLAYGIERRLAAHDLSTPEGRTRAAADALAVLAPIKDSLLAKDYAVQIAGRTRLREEDALAQLAALAPPPRYRDRDDGPANASATQPAAPAPAAASRAATAPERNRLRFEREFLSLAAQHPLVALAHADTLAQIQWHEEVHRLLADSILATLAENPAAAGVDIVTRATLVTPHAPRVLTGGLQREGAEPEAVGAYLAEELALGDAEEAIGALTAQLAGGVAPEEAELLHAAIATLQMDVAARRVAHRAVQHS